MTELRCSCRGMCRVVLSDQAEGLSSKRRVAQGSEKDSSSSVESSSILTTWDMGGQQFMNVVRDM